MKKLIMFVFLLFLFGGCNKEWHEDRWVNFWLSDDITYAWDNHVYSRVNFRVEYKIIGDPNADTSRIKVLDVTFEGRPGGSNFFNHLSGPRWSWLNNHELMSYDHLEFKVTTSSNSVKPIDLEINFEIETSFKDNKPDDRSITETLLTINNPDTTIYFTWSPPNFN